MSSQAAGKPAGPQPAIRAEVIHLPNVLKAKVGAGIDPDAVAKAQAALEALSTSFNEWLHEEIAKLEAARTAIHTGGMTPATAGDLYTHCHDLKGLGATYGYPLIGRIAASLCTLMGAEKRETAPLFLIDAHIDAIRAAIRDSIRDDQHPVGRALAQELEARVRDYAKASSGSSARP